MSSRQLGHREVHVGCSPITNNIYAGYVLKDGITWSDTNKTDVTHAAIGAVCEHAERFGKPITVNRNGRPAYRLVVEVLTGDKAP